MIKGDSPNRMAVFYDRGARLAEAAVQHDEARRYTKAVDAYARAVEVLVKGLRYDRNRTSHVFTALSAASTSKTPLSY